MRFNQLEAFPQYFTIMSFGTGLEVVFIKEEYTLSVLVGSHPYVVDMIAGNKNNNTIRVITVNLENPDDAPILNYAYDDEVTVYVGLKEVSDTPTEEI